MACGMSFTTSDDVLYFLYAPASGNAVFDALNFALSAPDNKENRYLVYLDDYEDDGCLMGEASAVKGTAKTFANFVDALDYFNQCLVDKQS